MILLRLPLQPSLQDSRFEWNPNIAQNVWDHRKVQCTNSMVPRRAFPRNSIGTGLRALQCAVPCAHNARFRDSEASSSTPFQACTIRVRRPFANCLRAGSLAFYKQKLLLIKVLPSFDCALSALLRTGESVPKIYKRVPPKGRRGFPLHAFLEIPGA